MTKPEAEKAILDVLKKYADETYIKHFRIYVNFKGTGEGDHFKIKEVLHVKISES